MATDIKSLRSKELSAMNAPELRSFISSAEKAGFSISKSKELGKAVNLLKVLEPSKYGTETVEAAKTSLQTQSSIPTLEKLGIPVPDWKMQQTAAPTATAAKPGGDLTSTLGSFQQGVFESATSPSLREQISAQLEPEGITRPEPLNRVNLYNQMREQYGVTGLEQTVTNLKAQVEDQYAARRQRTQAAEGQPVAMGVIAGRVGEIERQENERIDALTRQLNTFNDQLNTAYNTISTYMNFYGLDYQDSVARYNEEYNRNLQMYKLVDEEMDEQKAQARANLQIYLNGITEGTINYKNLPSSQKAFITKLEVQSGLPAGFSSTITSAAQNGKVLSTTTRESGNQKFVDVLTQMPNGQLKVNSILAGSVTGGGGAATASGFTKATDSYLNEALKILGEEDVRFSKNRVDQYGEPIKGDTTDKKFSEYELQMAKQRISSLVKDQELAKELFNRAMNVYGAERF